MSKSVSTTATARLKQDYMRLMKDPVPYVKAAPLPSNILTWHYVVTGPENTPYHGGIYFGKLVFPREFPFKPPAIYMITPNGRFKVNQKLCLSISDFHPDTWNPAWSVSTILTGLLSFMLENTPTTGSIDLSESAKKRLAAESKEFNLQDKIFCDLFPELAQEIRESLKRQQENQENLSRNTDKQNTDQQTNTTNSQNQFNLIINQNQNWFFSIINNMFVMVGLTALIFIVKHVFNTMN